MTHPVVTEPVQTEPDAQASVPLLLATLYLDANKLETDKLYELIYRRMFGDPVNGAVPHSHHDPGKGSLQRFSPTYNPAGHDTVVIQLALNHVGEIGSAWTVMREHLETLLRSEDLQMAWGHTLVYEGMEPPGGVRDQLLGSVRRLHSPHRRMWPIEESGVPGGRLQLMSVPVRGEGSDACTIYVALSPVGKPGEEQLLVTDTLYGRAAALLIPDLIAHKGYYQMRQVREHYLDQLNHSLGGLQATTGQLLEDLGKQVTETDKLDELARDYLALAQDVPQLNDVKSSLVQQLYNYDRRLKLTETNDVLEFHRAHLDAAKLEVDLLLGRVERALDTAGEAVRLSQVQVGKNQELQQKGIRQQQEAAKEEAERRQQRSQTALAILGTVLTVPQLIDREVTVDLVRWIGMPEPPGGYSAIDLLGVRVVITVALVALTLLVLRQLRRWRSNRSGSHMA